MGMISHELYIKTRPVYKIRLWRKNLSGLFLQSDVESKGLPPCEGAVNLAGENLMNPLRWCVVIT